MSDLASSAALAKSETVSPVLVYGVVALAALVVGALVFTFGFPFAIALADIAALSGLALIVGLTALDLRGRKG